MITKLLKVCIVLLLILIGLMWRESDAIAYAPTPDPVIMTDPLFEKIAYCESKNDSQATNPNSSAKGRFQFLDGTWKYYGVKLWGDTLASKSPFSYKDNTELAWYVYTNYGTGDWNPSRHCWGSVQ